ncbi:outer membrane protein [Sphingobium sp. CFD-2]|uniref:outer membrane protein n=1 Tax=Sphingobium sp. CFD-2 TaxID=2878542 RepID=UPI00214BECEB|nr:porin family protein [Sphingobium sp. CFD-2]
MDDFYAARSSTSPPPPWSNFAPPFSSNARVRTTATVDSKRISSSDNLDGWMIGGGAERLITDHISARLEYRYSDLGEGPSKFDRHQILVGAAYRF